MNHVIQKAIEHPFILVMLGVLFVLSILVFWLRARKEKSRSRQ